MLPPVIGSNRVGVERWHAARNTDGWQSMAWIQSNPDLSVIIAFLVMLAFGLGTAMVLLGAGLLTGKALTRMNGRILANAGRGKLLLGWMLLLLGAFVLTGFDKLLQTWALLILPEWSTSL
jgi:sulfite exporter TauE/SafE